MARKYTLSPRTQPTEQSVDSSLDAFIARANEHRVDVSPFDPEQREQALRRELEALRVREPRRARAWLALIGAFAAGAIVMHVVELARDRGPTIAPREPVAPVSEPAAPVSARAPAPTVVTPIEPSPAPPAAAPTPPAPSPASPPAAPAPSARATAPAAAPTPVPGQRVAPRPPRAKIVPSTAPAVGSADEPARPPETKSGSDGLYDPFSSQP
jgi:hypothetical protein